MSFAGYFALNIRDKKIKNRWGTCVLIKNHLSSDVTDIDTSIPDQVWLRLRYIPEVLFGFVYIPPSDSPYFSEASISAIQEKLKTSDAANGAVIMGDLNARFGYLLQQLPMHLELNNLSYPTIPDPIRFANNNAKMIFSICAEENLMVVNNAFLETQSYRS